MRRSVLAIALVIMFICSPSQAAPTADVAWVVSGHLPGALPTDGALLVAGANPGLALATAEPDLVSLYRLDTDGRPVLAGSFLPESALTALLLDDIDFDGHTELILGRGEEGALAVDRWLGSQRLPAEPRYAWTELRSLRAVTTKSGRLLVAAAQAGGLLTYLVGGRGLEPMGTIEPRYRFDLLGCADLDGDGQEELVTSASRVELVVFRWNGSQWTRWWQNYPWGGVAGAAVGDLDQDGRPELAIASGERLLYIFSRKALPAATSPVPPGSGAAPSTSLALRWQGAGLLPAATAGLVYLPASAAAPLVAGGSSAGLAAWNFGELRLLSFPPKSDLSKATVFQLRYATPGLREVLPAPPPPDRAGEGWPRLFLRTEAREVRAVAPVRLEPGNVHWETGTGRLPAPGASIIEGRLYLPLREVASRLGLSVRWDEDRRLTEVTTADGRVVQLAAERLPVVDGVECREAERVVVEGGRTLLEARTLEMLFPLQAGWPRLVVSVGARLFPAANLL